MSRILFTFKSPLTSIFVHWFVGTCYMFHFALFVSMCRKIMRKGVLCKPPLMSPRKRANTIRLHPRSR
jgi:E3 ubiquitin-protein ligase MARCH6